MTKKPHPSDAFNANIIANAIEWTAFMQAGRITECFSTNSGAAIAAAKRLANEHRRPALVYAINAEGRSALLASIQPEKEQPMTPNTISAAQICTLTAALTGEEVKRANSRDHAAKRLEMLATDAGIDSAAILAMNFDEALAFVQGRAKATAMGLNMAEADEIAIGHPEDIEVAAELMPAIVDRTARQGATALIEAARKTDKPVTKKPEGEGTDQKLKPEKPAKAPKAPKGDRAPGGKRGEVLAAAQRGELPAAPDFSAPTHARFRTKLAKLVAMAQAGDIEGLKAEAINPISSSPKAMAKFRDLAVIALEAKAQKAA